MHDARPVSWLLLLSVGAFVGLAAWWTCGLTASQRLGHLAAVMVREHGVTVPPAGMWDQVTWLAAHRLAQLQGMAGVLLVAAIVGMGEGVARRRTDVYGGFLLRWWTAGVVGLVLVPGAVLGYLLAPWPLPAMGGASGLALLLVLSLYGLFAGRPYIR